jgi:hypothetical protein
MIKVKSDVRVIEVNNETLSVGDDVYVYIESHWNSNKLINLVVDGKTYTIKSNDIIAAITNATNSNHLGI